MSTYHAGMLDQRIVFKRQVLTKDSSGGTAKGTPAVVGSAWACVMPAKPGRERTEAERPEGVLDYLVVVRFRSDLQDDDFIEWNGRILNIRAIQNAGSRQAYLEINATAGEAY